MRRSHTRWRLLRFSVCKSELCGRFIVTFSCVSCSNVFHRRLQGHSTSSFLCHWDVICATAEDDCRIIKRFLIAGLGRGRDVEELTIIVLTIIRLNVANIAFSPSARVNAMMNVGVWWTIMFWGVKAHPPWSPSRSMALAIIEQSDCAQRRHRSFKVNGFSLSRALSLFPLQFRFWSCVTAQP